MFKFLSLYFLLILLCLSGISFSQDQCETYSGSLCNFVVDQYQYSNNKIYKLLAALPQSVIESTLASTGYENLTITGPAASPKCFKDASKYFCGANFPSCNDSSGQSIKIEICRSVCEDVISSCGELFKGLGFDGFLPTDCSQFPVDGPCENLETVEVNFEEVVCQPPLIYNPNPSVITDNCPGACCLPCPVIDNFYPENLIPTFFIIFQTISTISFFGSLFVFLSYLMFKEKRRYPQLIILCLSLAATCIFGTNWIVIFSGKENILCNSPWEPSIAGDSPAICKAQGTLLTYFMLASTLWFGFLVLSVHLNVVWKNSSLEDYPYIYQIIIWGLPIASAIAANIEDSISNSSGIWCHPEIGFWIQVTLLIPIGVVAFPSFCINLVTLYKIYLVAKESNSKLQKIIRIQIRPFFFTFVVIIILIVYWIYSQSLQSFNSKVSDGKVPPWLYNWFLCVQNGFGQNECSKLAEVPHPSGIFIAEVLLHIIGLVVFFFFGLRLEIFRSWLHLILPKYFSENPTSSFTHDKSTNEKHEKQSNVVLEEQDLSSRIGNPDEIIRELQ